MLREKILSLFLVLVVITFAYAYDDGDFQVWNTDSEEFKISKGLKGTLEQEFRWGDNASRLYYQHYDIGIVKSFKNFDLGVGYRHVYERSNFRVNFRIENEPNIVATFKRDLFGFSLSDRNRLEYRHYDFQNDSWRYRNMITVKFPWKFTRFNIQPYIADDMFMNVNKLTFVTNRFYAGLGFSIRENIKAELYYLLQSAKGASNKWWDSNVFGSKVKVVF